jgi:hypothetical protein
MAIRYGPVGVHSSITGPVEVKHGDRVIETFGSDRPASAFAKGYNRAWWDREDELVPTKGEVYDETVREFAEYFKLDEDQIRDIMKEFLARPYSEAEEYMDPYDRAVGIAIYRVVKIKHAYRMASKSRERWRDRAVELGSPDHLVEDD